MTLGPNIPALQVKQRFLDGVLDRYVLVSGSYQNLADAKTRPVQILAFTIVQSKVNSTKSSPLLDTTLISNTAEFEMKRYRFDVVIVRILLFHQ